MSEAALQDALPEPPRRSLELVPPPRPGRQPARPLPPRLEVPFYDLTAALALRRELGISHALAQVLVRRGLSEPRTAHEFLNPSDKHPPSAFDGIEQATGVIDRHVRRGNRITVHGDYDVDGVCATAIMVRALRASGADVHPYLPSRIDDGYGLSAETVSRLAARGTDLLITVDCGITAVDEVAAARGAGIDVVVTDHHAPRADGRLPDCHIIHPRVCGYPCRELCGTAVSYKLAEALGADTVEDELELVALATVADLVPLVGENRRLVREGIRALASTSRPGLRALMSVAGADPSGLDTRTLGFRLAPRINAAGRLRRADAGLELLLTTEPGRAAEIAAELDAVNTERRIVEQRVTWEAEAELERIGARSGYVLAGKGWHPGVIGIVASRLVERCHRPVVLVSLEGEEGTGSGRSIPGFDLLGALHSCGDHLLRYGGHQAAAGLTCARAQVPEFQAAFDLHAQRTLTDELLHPAEQVDAVVSGAELGLSFAEELARMEPCGIGNARPRLLLPGARFDNVAPMGEGRHARFSVSSAGVRARAVAFGCDGALDCEPGTPLDATFRLEQNRWNGSVEPRLVLCNVRPCDPSPIEVLGEPDDYLRSVLAELDAPLPDAELRDARADAAESMPEARDPLTHAPTPLEYARAPGEYARIPVEYSRTPVEYARTPVEYSRSPLDRRGDSPLAALLDARAGLTAELRWQGEPASVLAVCADVPRRLDGLAARTGGFALTSYHALERDPAIASRFTHLVALDPPSHPAAARLLYVGAGYTHWAWGEAELRFAQQMHELEYGLRASLAALYRGLRRRERVTGQELERLLRGDGPHGRPARLAGRLVRVLAELELVSLDRNLPALAIAATAPTALERSRAYRAYAQRHEDGQRYLTSANQPTSD